MPGPSLRRRRLAGALRQLREGCGLTIEEAALKAGFSRAKLSRVESLENSINGDDTRTLCEALDVDAETTHILAELARHSRRRGWWQTYGDTLGKAADLIETESDAAHIYSFTVDVVPGQLQTERYARAVIGFGYPNASDEEIERRVKLRMERQERQNTDVWAIMDESALRKSIGNPDIMVEQIDSLIELAARPRVSVQVVPNTGHSALGIPFQLFALRDGMKYVFADTLTGALYIEESSDVQQYEITWSRLAAVALNFESSVERLTAIADEHRSNHSDSRISRLRMAEK